METFLIYLLKVAVLAAVLYLLYKWLLGKQTFHSFNRMTLLFICALSFILPACHIENEQLTSEVRKVFPVFATAATAPVEAGIAGNTLTAGNVLTEDNSAAMADETAGSSIEPAVSAEEWEEGAPVLTGSVLHEPVSVQLRDKANFYFHEVEFDRLEPGEYDADMLVPKEDDGLLYFEFEGQIQKFTVDSDGTVTVRGDKTGHIKDGKYRVETVTVEGKKQLKLSNGNKTMQFSVSALSAPSDFSEDNGDAVQITMMHIPENAGADSPSESSGRPDWGMILMLVNENLK